MANYQTDLKDVFFNLFEVFNATQYAEGYEESDLREIVEQLDKFVEKEVFSVREEGDHIGVKLTENGVVTPPGFKKASQAFYENGWFGLGYPEQIGGMPAPELVNLACTSLVTGANVSFSMYYGLTRAALNVILAIGSDEQKQKYVSSIMEGKWGGTMCLTEAGAGSDVGASKTTAIPMGDGRYKIKGTKIFISSGESDLYENNIHLVLARTPEAPEGTKGLSLFIVPRFNLDDQSSNDVVCTKIEEKMGLHGSSTCVMNFGDQDHCYGELIGQEFEGMKNMFIMMNEARLLCGMQGESQANLATMLSIQYAKERAQFGSEISNLPDVKRMLVKMRSLSRGMRALNFYTASLFDRVHKGESELEGRIALLTPICKAFGSDRGFDVSVDAIQVHGGYGYCSEYGIEQFARDTKIATIYEGTNGIQAIDFLLRKILKDQGKEITALLVEMGGDLKKAQSLGLDWELGVFGESMKLMELSLKKLGALAVSKQEGELLQKATDFLDFAGYLTTGWLLMNQAVLASGKLSEGDYYQSKVDDFRVFCSQCLSQANGKAKAIASETYDIQTVVL